MRFKTKENPQNPLTAAIGITVIALAIELFIFLSTAESRAAQTWPSVWGTVTSAHVGRAGGGGKAGGSARPTPRITYTYEVDGTTYTGDRYSSLTTTMSQASAEEVVARLQPGTKTLVYYNPANPAAAVLSTDVSNMFWIAHAGCGVLTIGSWIAYIRSRRAT